MLREAGSGQENLVVVGDCGLQIRYLYVREKLHAAKLLKNFPKKLPKRFGKLNKLVYLLNKLVVQIKTFLL